MLRLLGLCVFVAVVGPYAAFADAIRGALQEDFVCTGLNCTTTCNGPGGASTITGYRELSAWTIAQPDRLWLQKIDGNNVVTVRVLGVADRCEFGGEPMTISITPQVVPIPSPPPQCTCIGSQCNPPGCKR